MAVEVFPAHAGMNRLSLERREAQRAACCVPRARGDEPLRWAVTDQFLLFPAHARVPRARGDEPTAARRHDYRALCVPRARGDEPLSGADFV